MIDQFIYKDCSVQIIKEEKGYIIRLMNKFGFRWFKTSTNKGVRFKVKKAYNIEQLFINGNAQKYHGYAFIQI